MAKGGGTACNEATGEGRADAQMLSWRAEARLAPRRFLKRRKCGRVREKAGYSSQNINCFSELMNKLQKRMS
jgi:hypothetical protein